MPNGFWEGVPASVRKVTGVVDDFDPEVHDPHAQWKDWAGNRIAAVEVETEDGLIYIDDQHSTGWYKVTIGEGDAAFTHVEVPLHSIQDRI